MIRKRRKKKKREEDRTRKLQFGIIFGGALLAALLAATLPTSCNAPPIDDELIRQQMEDLAREAQERDAGSGR